MYYNVANSYVNEVLYSAVKATERDEVPLSEKVSRSESNAGRIFA